MTQNALNTLLAPSNQIHVGPMWDPSPVSRHLAITGQLNPEIDNRFKSEHGRFLSGTDNMKPNDDSTLERDQHKDVYEAEDLDDVLGSGIFDPFDRAGTANTNTGVFTSHYSLPGYIAREIPFTTSRDVTDLTDDASVVSVPGGGMAYVESYGRLMGPASLGPQPQQPHLRPAAPTSRDQAYVTLTARQPSGWDVDSLLNVAEMAGHHAPMPVRPPPARAMPVPGVPGCATSPISLTVPPRQPLPARSQPDTRYHPGASSVAGFGEPAFPYAPGSPSMYRPFPPGHPARQPFFDVRGVPTSPRHGKVPITPSQRRVPGRSFVNPIGARIAMGQEPAPSQGLSLAAFAVAGLMAGVALKLMHGAMTK